MADEEHLKILMQGVEVWNRWREENPDVRPNFYEADLSRANLSRANLGGADLRGAYLSEADLSGANLSGADLRWADVFQANLGGADLREANLNEAFLNRANLRGANLSLANLSLADLSKADLRGAHLRRAHLGGSDLGGANLSKADLRGSDLSLANLSKADLRGSDLGGANLSLANLSKVDLSKADLSKADLSKADLSEANLGGAKFKEAILYRAIISEAQLRETDLRGADLTEAVAVTQILGKAGLDYHVEAVEVLPDWLYLRAHAPSKPVEIDTSVDFTVFHAARVVPKRWYKLLVYVHLPSAFKLVLADKRSQLGARAGDFLTNQDHSALPIKQGAEIVIVPELPGCCFNPPRASLLWLEAWHRAEFRVQAEPGLPGFQLNRPVTGRVAFYVGPILVGEALVWAYIREDDSGVEGESPHTRVTTNPYQSIFVSYSHKDAAIVDGLEKAYAALGMKYLRDVRSLRSGQKWNPALLKMIEKADIFQLCWSNNAKVSRYVKQEWQHALSLGRPYFIRPVYWEKPMPKPPRALKDIHFAYYEKGGEG